MHSEDDEHMNLFGYLSLWWSRRVLRSDPAWRSWLPGKGNVLFSLLLFGTLLWVGRVGALPGFMPAAVSTSTISYQGRLADSNGEPLTATVNMEFRIYDVPTGGVALWQELWTGGNAVQVSDGLFNVMLGSLNTALAATIQGRNELYLGITVGTDSEMAPRVQLGAVPFSMQALTVPEGAISTTQLADGAVTQVKLANDIVFIPPDNSITTNKLVDGSVTTAKLQQKTYVRTYVINGTGADNYTIDISSYGFTNRPLIMCEITDTPNTVNHFFCAYSLDSSTASTAFIHVRPYNGSLSGPFGNFRFTLLMIGN